MAQLPWYDDMETKLAEGSHPFNLPALKLDLRTQVDREGYGPSNRKSHHNSPPPSPFPDDDELTSTSRAVNRTMIKMRAPIFSET